MSAVFKAIAVLFLTANIVLFSDKMTAAALNGLTLWLNTVVPSLFPFMVISSWLSFGSLRSKNPADKITLRLFGVPAALMPVFVIGIISGYPVGARLISSLYSEDRITRATAEHMLSFCNNAGIVFIISAVASSMLSDSRSGLFFIGICAFSSLFTGMIYNLLFPCRDSMRFIPRGTAKGTGIYTAISSAVRSILMVGGCIIFFFVVSESVMDLLPVSDGLMRGLIGGILEFTGGIGFLASSGYPKKVVYPLIAALLCWGGFSVHLQTLALVESDEIDMRKYMVCKAFSAAVAYFTAYFSFDSFFLKTTGTASAFNELPSSPSLFLISSLLSFAIYLLLKTKKQA